MAKAKGTTLIGAVRHLRKNRTRALEILPPALHHYLEERITESRWYPEADLHQLLEAMLEMIPGPRDEVLAQLGAASARDHLEGIYSHLRGGRSDGLARRAIALWSSQHDTGRFEMTTPTAHEAIMTVRDFGHPSEIMCGILGGYLAETLRVDGAVDVVIEKTACVLRNDPVCSWRRVWNGKTERKPRR
jgi:hypothetical protein